MPNAEQVLNSPLTCLEIRQIIQAKLEQALAGDSRLAEYVAVRAFEFKLDLAIILAGAVHTEIAHAVTGGKGTVTDSPDDPNIVIVRHVEQGQVSPNEARIDAGLGVPILTRDEKGRQVERHAHYTPEQKNRAQGR
jgi:hypothetical protein